MQGILIMLSYLIAAKHNTTVFHLIKSIDQLFQDSVEKLDILAFAAYQIGLYNESAEYNYRALALSEDDLFASESIRFNLGKALRFANRPAEAIAQFKQLPPTFDNQIELAVALYANNEKDLALSIINNTQPENEKQEKIKKFNIASHQLRKGEFEAGHRNLLLSRDVLGNVVNVPFVKKWDGTYEFPDNSRVLVVGEGGIGDEVIYLRFGLYLSLHGPNVKLTWATQHNLQELFNPLTLNANGFDNIVNLSDINANDYDYWVPAMELPVLLNVVEHALWEGPYLVPSLLKKRVVKKIPPRVLFSHLKRPYVIGIKCYGNPDYEHDAQRTIPENGLIQLIAEVAQESGCEYVVVKLEPELTPTIEGYNVISSSVTCQHFGDTVQWIMDTDLTISSCTSIAHVSGALGHPTVVLVPIMAYHTWANETIGNRSTWYGSNLNVIRQTKPADWSDPFIELKSLLKQKMEAHALEMTNRTTKYILLGE